MKAPREKKKSHLEANQLDTSNFLIQSLKSRRTWKDVLFQTLKGEKKNPVNQDWFIQQSYPSELMKKYKSFQHKKKLKAFKTTKPALQKILEYYTQKKSNTNPRAHKWTNFIWRIAKQIRNRTKLNIRHQLKRQELINISNNNEHKLPTLRLKDTHWQNGLKDKSQLYVVCKRLILQAKTAIG